MLRRLGFRFLFPLALVDGAVGAAGAVSAFRFGHALAPTAPTSPLDIMATLGAWFADMGLFFLWAPAFVSMAILTPVLAWALAGGNHALSPRGFWIYAAAVGAGAGFLLWPLTGFFVGVLMSWMPSGDPGTMHVFLRLATEAPRIFAWGLGTSLPALHWRGILVWGGLFGLANGALVRWRIARGAGPSA